MTETKSHLTKFTSSIIQNKKTLKNVLDSFSPKQTFIFITLFIVMLVSVLFILGKINKTFLVYLPERGGGISEGIIGSPRFINPILAISDTDKDLTSLVYSGLMKKNPDGTIVPDIAESYTISENGLTYSFKIKPGIKFQDNNPLTIDDIIFTVEKIKDAVVKSPLESTWQGILVSKDQNDPQTIVFKLAAPYASFLENTTFGILPKHIWNEFQTEEFNLSKVNLEAIGSGPYKISSITQNKNGVVEKIELNQWRRYSGKKPFIKKIKLVFYRNEADMIRAYRRGRVDQISSISPKNANELRDAGYQPTTAVLSRIFGLFFNPNQNEIFRDKSIITAINLGIDKEKIIDGTLYGFGKVIDSPVTNQDSDEKIDNNFAENLSTAQNILDNAGWKINEATGFREKSGKRLQFSISTADVGELRATSESIKEAMANLGIEVSVKVFEIGMLNQTIIRPRDYEALFFGQIVRNDSDLFAFWHSSQRNDPGLNISVYTNARVDKMLEELIATTDQTTREARLAEIASQIKSDLPAIFIYSPEFIYMKSERIKGIELGQMTSSSERFLGIADWYVRTDAVWKFLKPKDERAMTEN